jgi:hypothetical protein
MRHRPDARASRSHIGFLPRATLVAIGVLSALQARGETAAPSPGAEPRWPAAIEFELAARTDYVGGPVDVRKRDVVAASTNLRFASPARPIIAGLLIEYRVGDERADELLVAGVFTYKLSKWTAAASPFYKSLAHGDDGDWSYWASVRRHIAGRHALGIELFGALDTGRPRKWMLGYYGTVTEALSVSVSAGSGFDAGLDWVASTSVTWRPRRARR